MAETDAPACLTRIKVKDLPLLADVGINPDEIGRRQPLVITVEITLAAGPVREIGETVDYRKIARAAEDLAAVHIPLIETFAQQLGARCLAMKGVVSARIAVDKPFAITRGLAGVEVEMHNAAPGNQVENEAGYGRSGPMVTNERPKTAEPGS